MYNLEDITTIHLEVTSRCQASCPMCVRNIQGGITNPWLVEEDISINQFKEWFPEDFLKQLVHIIMCGNTGDPIIAQDTLEICEYLRSINPKIKLFIHTNGSARPSKWWKQLAKLNVRVIFGIDGLADTHALYRIGTDWNKIIENAQTFIKAGGVAEWHMLIFEHNKHQIDACEKMSNELKFDKFVRKNTSRFRDGFMPVITKDGKTSHVLYPSDRSTTISKKLFKINPEETKVINCKVKSPKSMYVNTHGDVTACCWLDFAGVPPYSFSKVNFNDRGFKNPNLKIQTLKEIFESKYFDKIEETWTNTPLKQCAKQCGEVDKSGEQFK